MKISIIIPLYKVEKYIERCLQSVVHQTFTDYEVVLVDDFSPDSALQIATQLLIENDIVFQTIKHKENRKQGTARNNGLKIANGKYIFFIDADDELANKNALQLLHNEIEKDNYDFVTAKEQHIEKDKKKNRDKPNNNITILKDSEIIKALSKNNISPVVWNKLIRKDFLLKNKICFFENTYFEDIPYSFTLCNEAKKVAILNQITYTYYFQENSSATTSTLSNEKVKDAINMCKQLLFYAEKNRVDKKVGVFPIHQIVSQSILYILAHPSLIIDEERWIKSYILFQKMYNHSFLRDYKKNLYFPAKISYFLVKNKYERKKYKIKGIGFIKRIFFGVFIRINFSYKIIF